MIATKRLQVRVYLDASGPNPVLHVQAYDENGFEIQEPLDGMEYAVLELRRGSSLVTVDSQVNPEMIVFVGKRSIKLALGSLKIKKGGWFARLKVFDVAHPNGQVLSHEVGPNVLLIEFV